MRRMLAVAVCLIAFALILPAAQAQPQATRPAQTELPGEFMGMVVRDPHYEWNTNPAFVGTNQAFYEEMGRNLQAAGVKWVRIEFFAQETGPNAGFVDTAQYEYFVNTIAPKYGLKVIGLLATPLVRWQSGAQKGQYLNPELIEAPTDDPSPNDPRACGKPGNESLYPYGCGTNLYMRIWLDNAFDVARRLPYNAMTGAGVAAFEVLNEENRYLNGGGKGMKPESVATMLTKFYRIYKNVQCAGGQIGGDCSQVQILLGGLHPDRCDDCKTLATPNGMTDRQYLDTIYKSPPFKDYRTGNGRFPVDGIGYHPYPAEMRSGLLPEPTGSADLYRISQRMRDIRAVMTSNGDTANKIWVTEIGDRGAPSDMDNQRRQADFMRAAYWMLWQQRNYVQTVLWFKYEDFADRNPDTLQITGWQNWGVVRLVPRTPTADCSRCEYDVNGTVQVFKEAYTTYQRIATTGEGLQIASRISLPVVGAGSATP